MTAKHNIALKVAAIGLAAFLLSARAGDARDDDIALWQVGVGATAGVPQGAFADAISETRWGGYGYFTRRVRATPFRLGVALGLLGNGSVDVVYDGRGGRRNRSLDATLSNGLYSGHFLARVQPVYGRLSPYAEAAIGIQTFDTKLVLRDCYGPCTLPTRSRSDLAFSGGGGGGLAVRVRNEEGERGISAEVGARYLFGSEVTYYLPDDLPELAGEGDVIPQFSSTSLITITFGVVFDF